MELMAKTKLEVLGIDNFSNYYSPLMKISHVKSGDLIVRDVDICNSAAVSEVFYEFMPTHVIHLAAQGGVRPHVEQQIAGGIDGGEDGLGGIYPAMANAIWMYHCLGVPEDDWRLRTEPERRIHDAVSETSAAAVRTAPCAATYFASASSPLSASMI